MKTLLNGKTTTPIVWGMVAATLMVACAGDLVTDDKDDVVSADGSELEVVRLDAADANSPYRGEIELDERIGDSVTHRLSYHLWELNLDRDIDAFVDLASREGDDTFLLIYKLTDGRWTLYDYNDDCRGSLNSCLELELTEGEYLLAASTYNYVRRGRRTAFTYQLEVFCQGGCEEEPQLCGSRGLAPCDEGDFCDWDNTSRMPTCGAADGPGICQPIPDGCYEVYAPVCGCDGQTYSNDCMANAAGTDVSYEGMCTRPGHEEGEICGGIAGFLCADGLACSYANSGGCGIVDAAGTCVSTEPTMCTRHYMPVCGCDGVTYGNDCERVAALVGLDHEGACERPGQGVGETCAGIAALQCQEGLVCNFGDNVGCSIVDMGGHCVDPNEPVACTMEYAPVCGCDGETYSNDCMRAVAGVPLSGRGFCEE